MKYFYNNDSNEYVTKAENIISEVDGYQMAQLNMKKKKFEKSYNEMQHIKKMYHDEKKAKNMKSWNPKTYNLRSLKI